VTARRWLILATIVFACLGVAALVLRQRATHPRAGEITVAEALGGAPAAGFARATAPRRFSFPDDHGPHPGFRTEWWYFTGNLSAADGRRFGYQLTFFRVALVPEPVERPSRWGTDAVFMAHFALTDVAGKRFHHAERFSRSALGLAGAGGRPLRVWLEEWAAVETTAEPWSMRLSAGEGDAAIDLTVRSLKPAVLHGEGGLSRKSGEPGNASYYYSLTRMATSGTVRAGGETFAVTGTSWLDREWSTSALGNDQVGWDWFALQLDDGREIMYYRLRRRDGTTDPSSAGTLVAADGSAHHLDADAVALVPREWWTSTDGAARYPSRWQLQIPSAAIDLEIVPRLAAQELRASVRYWEGAVAVKGTTDKGLHGVGYVELTGYAAPRLTEK